MRIDQTLAGQPDSTPAAPLPDKPIMTLSAYSIQGKRNHMEDFFDIGYQMKPCDQRRPNEWPYEYFYFGIFDGHGGREAANFAKQNLLKFITDQKDFWSQNDDDVKRAIRTGFARTHSAMREAMPDWSRSGRCLPSTAGTTASILFIKNGKFYSGHVGDSRIVISQENPETKNWISRQLTEDHKPESEQEKTRIERAGGEVRNKVGVYRVVWKRPILNYNTESKLLFKKNPNYEDHAKTVSTYPVAESMIDSYQTIPFLAIARSLGDFWSLNPYSGQYIVSPEPDIDCRPIDSTDNCILLATDGLWNVMNSSYAVRILQELNITKSNGRHKDQYLAVNNFYDVAGRSDNYAESLVYFAYQIWERRRLRSDNITVVVAMLHDILGHFHRTNKPYATRASLNSSKLNELHREPSKLRPVQIEQTSSYLEEISLNREPEFLVHPTKVFEDKWQKLQNYLILPPTILELEEEFDRFDMTYPNNYALLSAAECRKITLRDRYGDPDYVYIKQVSDDPADYIDLPKRIGKSGKEVKDASAQATQSIHDFGQPWSQLYADEVGPFADVYDENGYLIIKPRILSVSNRDISLMSVSPTTSPDNCNEDDDVDAEDHDDDGESNLSSDEKNGPKLRCLLNYTPPPRRTTRSSYPSVSENAKRKFQINSSPTPKTKRRRSQPVRCAVK